VEVVVLDDVGVAGAHVGGQPREEVRLVRRCVAARLERDGRARGIADGDEEDAVAPRVEPRCLEVELQPPERVELELAEAGAPGRDEVLLLEREDERLARLELAQVRDGPPQAAAGAVEHDPREGAQVVGADEEPERARARELAPREAPPRRARGAQGAAEVREILERGEEQPRPEADGVALERARAGHPPPHEGAPVRLRPHRHDAGRRVPPPDPLVGDRRGGRHH
jgi:hypothetical protein